MYQVAERLMDAHIENRQALDVIEHNNGEDILIYADPPYVKATRTLNGDQYRFEMTDAEHIQLLNSLVRHEGMVMISGYDCEMYRDMLRGWTMESIKTKAERGVIRTECLWSNPKAVRKRAQTMMTI